MVRSGLAKGGGVAAAAIGGLLIAGVLSSALEEAGRRPPSLMPPAEVPAAPPRDEVERSAALQAARAVVTVPPPSPADRLPPRPPRGGSRPDDSAPPETAAAAEEPPARDVVHLRPPVTIEAGAVLRSRDIAIRLAGIEMPPADAVCVDGGQRLWACGSRATATIRNLTGGAEIACRLTEPDGTPPAADLPPAATCRAFGSDLARSLVQLGFARPMPGAGPDLDRDGADARRAGRGLWSGGWTIR